MTTALYLHGISSTKLLLADTTVGKVFLLLLLAPPLAVELVLLPVDFVSLSLALLLRYLVGPLGGYLMHD